MKKYYRAKREKVREDAIIVNGGTQEDNDRLKRELMREHVIYYEFDDETRYIEEVYHDGEPNVCKGEFGKTLHPYDNPLRYICEDHFYDPEEVSEITQEEMEGDLFVTAI